MKSGERAAPRSAGVLPRETVAGACFEPWFERAALRPSGLRVPRPVAGHRLPRRPAAASRPVT